MGPNDSPKRTHDPVQQLALGVSTVWSMGALELDGDSLYYSLVAPRENPTTGINFNSPYSATQPLPSSVPSLFDPQTGHYHFTPNVVGEFIAGVEISEYRVDTTTQMPILIGRSMTEFDAQIRTNQKADSLINLELDLNSPFLTLHPHTGKIVVDQNCGSDTLFLPFVTPVDAYSVNTTDIRIYDSLSVPLPVSSVIMDVDEHGQTWEVGFILNPGFQFNGNHTLVFRKGIDGNTLRSICGIEIPEFDTLILRVTNCPALDISENQLSEWILYPNPSTGRVFIRSEISQTPMDIAIYDLSGHILGRPIPTNNELDLSSLSPGVYILEIQSLNGVQRKKIILK